MYYNLETLTTDDDLHLVWANPETNAGHYATFDIHAISETDAGLEIVGATDTTESRHFESPVDNVRVLNTAGTDTTSVRTILGMAPASNGIHWDLFFTLLTLDYSPAEALDFVALRCSSVPLDWYLDVRGEPPAEIHAHMDDISDELVSLVAATL